MEKKYYTKLLQCKDGKTICKQDVLVVGMAYDTEHKEHRCPMY